MKEAKPESLMTPEEVAEWLRVSPAWVRQHASGSRRPLLKGVKLGAAWRFRREDVEALIRHCEQFKEVA